MTIYRHATLNELSLALDWAADEGWNPGREDAAAFFAADPEGFFVAVEDGQPVAFIAVINHTADFAFLGLYIVREAFRGRGIGLGLWTHALQHAGARTVGLDGVEAQQDNYLSSGFTYAGGTTRFTGQITPARHPDVDLTELRDVDALIDMEASASGVAKPAYLRPWLTGDTHRSTFVKRDDGAVTGFCTIRSCRSGAKIGPLVAKDPETAHQLMAHAVTGLEGPFTIDVPNTSQALTDLCHSLGWQPGFQTARMYKGAFDACEHPCFAVSSLELG